MTPLLSLLAVASAIGTAPSNPVVPYLHAPSVDTYAHFDPNGLTILPDGRFIKPVGTHFHVAKWPNGLTLSPDGRTLFVASAHVGQLITGWNTPSPQIVNAVPDPANISDDRAYGGAAVFTPDGKSLYWSSGNFGAVYKVDVAAAMAAKTAKTTTMMFGEAFTYDAAPAAVAKTISLNTTTGGRVFTDSEVMDLALSPDGRTLYCDDVTNFRVATIDTVTDTVVSSVDVGRDPYALAVDGTNVFVANIGMFRYQPVPAPSVTTFDKRGLTFPAFGVPSTGARDGVDDEGRHVPGVGDPNAPESFSIWGLNMADPLHPQVASRLKTGLLVGAPSDGGNTVGGSAPNFLVVHGHAMYVGNNNNDMISTVDLPTGRIVRETRIVPSPLTAKLRGVCPAGMAISRDGSRLYICEMGLNAIGVMDTRSGRMLGHIPTAWYPYRVTLSRDGRSLIAICFRGFGNGPKLSHQRWPGENPYQGLTGTVHVIAVPSTNAQLAAMTQNVLAYNGLVNKAVDRPKMTSPVIPARVGVPSPDIQYVVFIIKENHSFDTIFDHVPGTASEPKMLQWGLHQQIAEKGQPTLSDIAVMINHNKLARQFALSDNFYVQPEASGVGHRWLVGVQPNNWAQMTYTLRWDFNLTSTAPGRLQSFGGNASIAPEDYPEAGTMWDHLDHYSIPFRNYGEGFEFAGVGEDDNEENTGARETVNIPMPEVLYENTCREFPNFNMSIPDVYRAKLLARDFTDRFVSGKYPMPHFINIALCNDHGSDPDPKHGYNYVASWMADDDSGLGQVVQFLSHTPYWKHMAIFVTQDDSGSENDHIDGQRSVMLIISPWARHGYVSHRHTTIMSMHRTLYEILGLPPLNMFDAVANDFTDAFTTTPDFTPYTWSPVDARLFDPVRSHDPRDPDYQQARREHAVTMDDPAVIDQVLSREP